MFFEIPENPGDSGFLGYPRIIPSCIPDFDIMPKGTLVSFCTRDVRITLNIINVLVLAYGTKISKD